MLKIRILNIIYSFLSAVKVLTVKNLPDKIKLRLTKRSFALTERSFSLMMCLAVPFS